MLAKTLVLVTAALGGIALADPNEEVTSGNIAVYTVNDYDGVGGGTDSYTFYSGDGSTADGWPAKAD
jgi:hypothetical protein